MANISVDALARDGFRSFRYKPLDKRGVEQRFLAKGLSMPPWARRQPFPLLAGPGPRESIPEFQIHITPYEQKCSIILKLFITKK